MRISKKIKNKQTHIYHSLNYAVFDELNIDIIENSKRIYWYVSIYHLICVIMSFVISVVCVFKKLHFGYKLKNAS
jgi:hypothetical protein